MHRRSRMRRGEHAPVADVEALVMRRGEDDIPRLEVPLRHGVALLDLVVRRAADALVAGVAVRGVDDPEQSHPLGPVPPHT